MPSFVEFSIVWFDENALNVRVRASNGLFSGETTAYVRNNVLPRFAETLAGFPDSPQDVRSLELGTFDPSFAGGGASLLFRCRDGVGHAEVEVKLRADPGPERCSDFLQLGIEVEPAVVDLFVDQLRRAPVRQGETIILSSVPGFTL